MVRTMAAALRKKPGLEPLQHPFDLACRSKPIPGVGCGGLFHDAHEALRHIGLPLPQRHEPPLTDLVAQIVKPLGREG